MSAPVLLPYGVARHRPPLACAACGELASLLRYVPDAVDGRAGHLCRPCDPLSRLTPAERARSGR